LDESELVFDSSIGSIEYLERYVIILIHHIGGRENKRLTGLSIQERNFGEHCVIRVVESLVEIETSNDSGS